MTIGIGVNSGSAPGFANSLTLSGLAPAVSGSTFVVVTYSTGAGSNGSTQNASASSCTISGSVLTVGGTVTGVISVSQFVLFPGVPNGLFVTSLGTGTGGAGTYNLSASTTVSSPIAMTFCNVTDSKGNLYTPAILNFPVQPTFQFGYIFTCQNAIGGSGLSVTWAPNQGSNLLIQFIEIIGATVPVSIDQISAANNGNSTSMPCPSVTIVQPNELILGIVVTAQGALATITPTSGTLIRQDQDTTNFLSLTSSFRIVTATGTYTPGFTASVSSQFGSGTLSFIQGSSANAAAIAWTN